MDKKKKKKTYQPPIVKEIGTGVEQALGVSSCSDGGFFSEDPCSGGSAPVEGCPGGPLNTGCWAGDQDIAGCPGGGLF